MAKVGPVHAHALTILQTPHVVPIDFRVTETRPTMLHTLRIEIRNIPWIRSITWDLEKLLASYRVIENLRFLFLICFGQRLEKSHFWLKSVSPLLSIVTVETTDTICIGVINLEK